MIKAVLFDFGGVIAEEGFRDGLKALAESQSLNAKDMFSAGMDAVYDSGWVVGQGTESDFWQIMTTKTGLEGDPDEMRELILERFVIQPSMLALVDLLRRQGKRVGILSDQTEWLDELDRRHDIFRHFDHLYISYRMGKGKRDPSLFDDIAKDLDLPPHSILFIDDNPGNVERARERGWQGIVFSDEKDLRKRLQALGLLPSQ